MKQLQGTELVPVVYDATSWSRAASGSIWKAAVSQTQTPWGRSRMRKPIVLPFPPDSKLSVPADITVLLSRSQRDSLFWRAVPVVCLAPLGESPSPPPHHHQSVPLQNWPILSSYCNTGHPSLEEPLCSDSLSLGTSQKESNVVWSLGQLLCCCTCLQAPRAHPWFNIIMRKAGFLVYKWETKLQQP